MHLGFRFTGADPPMCSTIRRPLVHALTPIPRFTCVTLLANESSPRLPQVPPHVYWPRLDILRTTSLLDDVDSVARVTYEPVHHLGQTTGGETPLASTYPFPEQQPSLLVRQCGTASPRGTASDVSMACGPTPTRPPFFSCLESPSLLLAWALHVPLPEGCQRGCSGGGEWDMDAGGHAWGGGGRTGWRCVPRPGIVVGLSGSLPAAAGWFFFMSSSGSRRGGPKCPRQCSREERGLLERLFWAQGAVHDGPPAVSVRHFPNGDGNGCPDVSGIMA
jgi:hypothetical protein